MKGRRETGRERERDMKEIGNTLIDYRHLSKSTFAFLIILPKSSKSIVVGSSNSTRKEDVTFGTSLYLKSHRNRSHEFKSIALTPSIIETSHFNFSFIYYFYLKVILKRKDF